MPQVRLTQAEVQRILELEKRVSANIVWKHDDTHNQDWAVFEVAVKNEGGWELKIYGKAQIVTPHKVSYSLSWPLGDETHRIFSLDVKGRHKNKVINRKEWKGETHKQVWKDKEPNYAYTPAETIPEDPNAAFLEFCEECNIKFTGQIGDVPDT